MDGMGWVQGQKAKGVETRMGKGEIRKNFIFVVLYFAKVKSA